MNAADIMTRDPTTIHPEASLSDAVQLMLDRHVSGLPVLDDANHLVGIVTEGDLLRRTETGTEGHANWLQAFFRPGQQADRFVQAHGRQVQEVMVHDVDSVGEATPLRDVVTLMQRKRIKRVPVLRDGALVGIVARADLMRALADVLTQPVVPLDDAAIKARLSTELGSRDWYPKTVTAIVAQGHVALYGTLFNEHDRNAIRVMAENIPGVLSVQDHLVFVEPNSGMSFDPDDKGLAS